MYHLFLHIIRFTLKKYFAFIAFMTVLVFTFTSTETKKNKHTSTYTLVTIQCKNNAIPDFTLNYDANRSEKNIARLCNCIEDTLTGWEKETALKLNTGKQDEINAVHMAGFRALYGKRISECSEK